MTRPRWQSLIAIVSFCHPGIDINWKHCCCCRCSYKIEITQPAHCVVWHDAGEAICLNCNLLLNMDAGPLIFSLSFLRLLRPKREKQQKIVILNCTFLLLCHCLLQLSSKKVAAGQLRKVLFMGNSTAGRRFIFPLKANRAFPSLALFLSNSTCRANSLLFPSPTSHINNNLRHMIGNGDGSSGSGG